MQLCHILDCYMYVLWSLLRSAHLFVVYYVILISELVHIYAHTKLLNVQLVWLTVFVGTLLLGVDLGFAVGVGFSLLVVVFKVALWVCIWCTETFLVCTFVSHAGSNTDIFILVTFFNIENFILCIVLPLLDPKPHFTKKRKSWIARCINMNIVIECYV